MKFISAALAAAAVLATTIAAAPGAPIHGIKCDAMEGSVLHTHQHLAIFNHGKPVGIPPDVGQSALGQCYYWTHTHTPDGIIHVESPVFREFYLGDFFDVWDEPLTRGNVAGAKTKPGEKITVWVDGSRYAGDPRKIELTNHLDVTIDVGAPAAKPKPYTTWNGL